MTGQIECPLCGARLLHQGAPPVRIACPVCGGVFSPERNRASDVIDVRAVPVGESLLEEEAGIHADTTDSSPVPIPDNEKGGGEPRVEVRYWRLGQPRSAGGGCGLGCLAVLFLTLFLLLRGCQSLF